MGTFQFNYVFASLSILVLLFFFFTNRKKNPIADPYFMLLLSILLLRFLYLIIFPPSDDGLVLNDVVLLQSQIFVVVLFYLHLLNQTGVQRLSRLKLEFHLIYSCLHLPVFYLLYKVFFPKTPLHIATAIVVFTYVLVYFYLLIRVFLKYSKTPNGSYDSYTDSEKAIVQKWVFFISVSFVIFLFSNLFTFFYNRIRHQQISASYYYFISSSFWLLVLLRILTDPLFLMGANNISIRSNRLNKNNSSLSPCWSNTSSEISNQQDFLLSQKIEFQVPYYMRATEDFFENSFDFSQQKFGITDLSFKLHVPQSHLKFIFKYHCEFGFSYYLVSLRIQKATDLMMSDFIKFNTLEKVSSMVGYSNYNTFFLNFKSVVGMTPNQFVKQMV
jgi:AraC-like DNA-binding protein